MSKYEVPNRIWLQVYGEDEPYEFDTNTVKDGDITWCQHKIWESDIEYIRAKPKKSRK